jgi:hypothetical protein
MGLQKSGMIAALACALALAACGQQQAPPGEEAELRLTTPAPTPAPLTPEQLDARRIADLTAINSALQAYYQQHGAYPLSPRQGFTNVIDGGAEWIPGLAPAFIPALPREPRMNDDVNSQYWYASSGVDYKLVVLNVGGACGPQIERDGVRIDPMRNPDAGCYAYGFWTQGYRDR